MYLQCARGDNTPQDSEDPDAMSVVAASGGDGDTVVGAQGGGGLPFGGLMVFPSSITYLARNGKKHANSPLIQLILLLKSVDTCFSRMPASGWKTAHRKRLFRDNDRFVVYTLERLILERDVPSRGIHRKLGEGMVLVLQHACVSTEPETGACCLFLFSPCCGKRHLFFGNTPFSSFNSCKS